MGRCWARTAHSSSRPGSCPSTATPRRWGQPSITPSDSTTYEINGICLQSACAGSGAARRVGPGPDTLTYGVRDTLTVTSDHDARPPRRRPAPRPDARQHHHRLQRDLHRLAGLGRAAVLQASEAWIVSRASCRRAAATRWAIEDATLMQTTAPKPLFRARPYVNVGSNTLITVLWRRNRRKHQPAANFGGFGHRGLRHGTSSSAGQAVSRCQRRPRAARPRPPPQVPVTAQGAGSLTLNLASLGGRCDQRLRFYRQRRGAGSIWGGHRLRLI